MLYVHTAAIYGGMLCSLHQVLWRSDAFLRSQRKQQTYTPAVYNNPVAQDAVMCPVCLWKGCHSSLFTGPVFPRNKRSCLLHHSFQSDVSLYFKAHTQRIYVCLFCGFIGLLMFWQRAQLRKVFTWWCPLSREGHCCRRIGKARHTIWCACCYG